MRISDWSSDVGSSDLLLGKIDQPRMDIGLARDRRCVAERLRDGFEHRLDADVVPSRGERVEREHAPAPRAEMLGGEILAPPHAATIVYGVRPDQMPLAPHHNPEPQVFAGAPRAFDLH